jgi:hypothetical protein
LVVRNEWIKEEKRERKHLNYIAEERSCGLIQRKMEDISEVKKKDKGCQEMENENLWGERRDWRILVYRPVNLRNGNSAILLLLLLLPLVIIIIIIIIIINTMKIGSRCSVVGIATGYGLDNRGVGVRVPVISRIFSCPRRSDRLCGPASLLSCG